MNRAIIITPYFGRWPTWMPAFLLSCARNPDFDFLFLTDCDIPEVDYPNVRFRAETLEGLNALASRRLGLSINKRPYSQVDLRPAYGEIFRNDLEGREFWGHCDLDVIWGRVSRFLTPKVLDQWDIISSRQGFTAGHFTLWRNDPKTNRLYTRIPEYHQRLSEPGHGNMDEKGTSHYLRDLEARDDPERPRVYWSQNLGVGWTELEQRPLGWRWQDGQLFDADNREWMAMHFMRWKRSMKSIDFTYGDQPSAFSVEPEGIRKR
jgi:hypothetical protein